MGGHLDPQRPERPKIVPLRYYNYGGTICTWDNPVNEIPPSVAFLLSQLGFEVGRELGEALDGMDLGLREFGLLRLVSVADTGGGSQRALGRMLRLTPNRMVALVDGLESKGLLERRAHPTDRRAHDLALTDAGRTALGRGFQAAVGVEAHMCAPLDPHEREQLLGLLTKLAQARIDRGDTLPGVHPGMLAKDDAPPRGSESREPGTGA
jgi:DNA-binding MarR family transcriptional regulator